MTYQFVNVAFERLTAKESKGYFGNVARYIDKFGGELDDKIIEAFSTGFEDEPVYKPIQFLSFCQTLMDRSCWLARRYRKALDAESPIYGVDPAAEIVEEFGFSMEAEHVVEQITKEYDELYILTSMMMNFDPEQNITWDWEFRFFNPSSKNDSGEWVNIHGADTYGDAEIHMNEIAEQLNAAKPSNVLENLRRMKDQRGM
jgi:hypothetical protein|tara:strand:- start:192 stop:794 length:603 start_codon:yes stop_codon:yes gene_type:complete